MSKQHYVPRMLLRNFSVDHEKKYIHIHLLKDNRFLYSKLIYDQAQKENYYGVDQELESLF